ncbi:hypothetical protein ACQEVX_00905 [Streptomyces syringium]|uniref:hypothetical protein n=1 Tax=Streptomyces syringium TaxID=76729 RepID=UPI003D940026
MGGGLGAAEFGLVEPADPLGFVVGASLCRREEGGVAVEVGERRLVVLVGAARTRRARSMASTRGVRPRVAERAAAVMVWASAARPEL